MKSFYKIFNKALKNGPPNCGGRLAYRYVSKMKKFKQSLIGVVILLFCSNVHSHGIGAYGHVQGGLLNTEDDTGGYLSTGFFLGYELGAVVGAEFQSVSDTEIYNVSFGLGYFVEQSTIFKLELGGGSEKSFYKATLENHLPRENEYSKSRWLISLSYQEYNDENSSSFILLGIGKAFY